MKKKANESKKLINRREEGGMIWQVKVQNNKAVELMGYAFALWALQNSNIILKQGDVDDAQSYLKQPQVAQVVLILRLLTLDSKADGGDHRFVRIRNPIEIAEGKSLKLGVASCVLALLGFDVSCACYSEFLSKRDYDEFEYLFRAFGVEQYINYGTFYQLCENVMNSDIDIRGTVEDMVLGKSKKRLKQNKYNWNSNATRLKVLLIDEVDVFFNTEFYSSAYVIGATIKHASLTFDVLTGDMQYNTRRISMNGIGPGSNNNGDDSGNVNTTGIGGGKSVSNVGISIAAMQDSIHINRIKF